MEKVIAEKSDVGKRMDLLLSLKLAQYSRTNVRKLLDAGKVRLNGEVEYRPNYKMAEGDIVEIDEEESLARKHLEPYAMDLDIVYQDHDILIINKPAGLKVHPTAIDDKKSLLNAAYHVLHGKLGEYGVNLINRIDKGTSGLVVLAISPQGAWYYAKEFASNRVTKEYLAVVNQKWRAKYGYEEVHASNFLAYDHLEQKQVIAQTKGEFAESTFQLEHGGAEFPMPESLARDYVTLIAKPRTGRTHQIRVQLAHLGFPILGDNKYGGDKSKRMMLHAWRIKLTRPDGSLIEVEAALKELASRA